MPVNIILEDFAFQPTKAHEDDAGFDLYSPEDKVVPAHGSAVFDTGVHVELRKNSVGMIKSKSGLNVKHGITSEGVIDVGYTGSIKVKLYNHSDEDYEVKRGDKISQLVVMPFFNVRLNVVDEFETTERGDNGFGSTGR